MSINYRDLDTMLHEQGSAMSDEFSKLVSTRGTILNLVEIGSIPQGAGFNFQAEVNTEGKSASVIDYCVNQALTRSEQICLEDARSGYLWEQKVRNEKLNLIDNCLSSLEERVLYEYKRFVRNIDSSELLASLGAVYGNLLEDGAGAYPILVKESGEPIFLCIVSSEEIKKFRDSSKKISIPKESVDVTDFLKTRLARVDDESSDYLMVNGFVFICSDLLPRYRSDKSEIPKYTTLDSSIGQQFMLSEEYEAAEFGMAVVWNSKAIQLLVTEKVAFGARFTWENLPNGDIDSKEFNPLSNIGRFYAQMMNAVRPCIVQWGATITYRR
jgi:hypothetical protein